MGYAPREIVRRIESRMKRVRVNIQSKVFNLFAVRIANFKRRMENCGLALRLYRLSDLPMLRSLFTPEIFLETSGFELKVSSLLGFYKWLKATFQMVYVIEVEENGGRRVAGFAGLYNMKIGKSLWLSLTIFNPKDRKRGYGEQALELLLDLLQRNGAAETVYAEVLKTNVASLCLLRKLGFEVSRCYEDSFILGKRSKVESEEALVNLNWNTIGMKT
jgi:RimJ/RimL family protein N-acetyltransferase